MQGSELGHLKSYMYAYFLVVHYNINLKSTHPKEGHPPLRVSLPLNKNNILVNKSKQISVTLKLNDT